MGDTPAPKRSRQSAPPGAFWRQEGRPLMEVRPCSLSRALLPRKHRRQKAEFRFHFGGIGHSIRYLLAEEFAVALAKPVNSHFERSLRGVHFAGQSSIRRAIIAEKEHLQSLEMVRAAVLDEFVAQRCDDSIEHRNRPTPFEDPLRSLIMSRLALVSLFAGREFQRHKPPTAALARALAILFVGHKEFQGGQNEGAEPAFFRDSAVEVSAFQHAHEEFLGEILRLIWRITAPPEISIQRVPVVLGQKSESGPSFFSLWIAGSDHQGPTGGRKPGWPRQRVQGLSARHRFYSQLFYPQCRSAKQ